jgi:hypothetical protein
LKSIDDHLPSRQWSQPSGLRAKPKISIDEMLSDAPDRPLVELDGPLRIEGPSLGASTNEELLVGSRFSYSRMILLLPRSIGPQSILVVVPNACSSMSDPDGVTHTRARNQIKVDVEVLDYYGATELGADVTKGVLALFSSQLVLLAIGRLTQSRSETAHHGGHTPESLNHSEPGTGVLTL